MTEEQQMSKRLRRLHQLGRLLLWRLHQIQLVHSLQHVCMHIKRDMHDSVLVSEITLHDLGQASIKRWIH